MATPWWAKVTPDYYQRPSDLSKTLAPRAAHYAAVIADTHLRDEPQIAGAFLRGNVPYSTAVRAARQYAVVKAQATSGLMTNAGMPGQVSDTQRKATSPPAVPLPPEDTESIWGTATNPWDAFVNANTKIMDKWDQFAAGKPIPTADNVLAGLKSVPNAMMQVPNMLFSATSVPIAQYLSNYQANPAPAPGSSLLDRALNVALPMGVAGAQAIGAAPLTQGQAQDMQRAGKDPNSWASRYGWYYDDMEAGQRAVADSDIRQFSQNYDPEKVQAVREIITSNVLNDGNADALSPSSQAFIAGLQGDNPPPKDAELFERMSKSASTRPGGVVSDLLGFDRGSEGSQVAAALGDLAFYWFGDPIAGGVKALSAARIQRMVPAGSLAGLENSIIAVKEPGVLHSPPKTALGRNMDDILDTVDQVHTLLSTKMPTKAMEARALNEAGQIYGQFALKHPDLVPQYSFIAQFKAGKVEWIGPKNPEDMAKAEAKAKDGREAFDPWYLKVVDKPTKPGYVIDRSTPEAQQQSLNEARYDITKRMSEWMYIDGAMGNRPIIKGQIMMPGEVAFNRKVRAAVAPIRDRLIGADGRVLDAINGKVPMPNVHFTGQLDRQADLFVGKSNGEWLKSNYTMKWKPTLEKVAARIGMSYSDKPILWQDPGSLTVMERMGIAHMPRRLAQVHAARWAQSNPAERKQMYDQFQAMMAEAAHFKDTPLARQVYNVMTKGNGSGIANPGVLQPMEAYTASRADNEIRAGDAKIAAGIWDYQMADGTVAPNYRVIRAMQQRTGLLSAVTGLFNARILNAPTAVWKVGKVGNPANMGRQVLEAYALLAADQGVGRMLDAALWKRRMVANATLEGRLENNEISKAANAVHKSATNQDMLDLTKLHRSGDFVGYRQKLVDTVTAAGYDKQITGALATLAEGVKIEDLMRLNPAGKMAVGLSGLLSPLRRVRLVWQDTTGAKDAMTDAAWHQYADQDFIDGLTKYSLGQFGHSADNYMMLSGASAADEMAKAAQLGVGSRPALIPNGREWMGAAGDGGAINWFRELDSRQTDKVGGDILRALAIQARHSGPATIADILNQGRVGEQIPSHLNTAEDIARWKIADSESGARLRQMADRLALDANGDHIPTALGGHGPWDDAVDRLVQVQLRDAAEHLGAKIDPNTGNFKWDKSYNAMLDKLGYNARINLQDVSAIDDKVRPTELSTPLYIPNFGAYNKKSLADWATKLYGFTVARPLQRLAINPIYLMNKSLAYREMGPMAAELISRGRTPKQAAALLEYGANKYAVNTTFRYTDNVPEHSFFSEITENFLMFNRASEDFLRRFSKIAGASPQILSRAYLLMEAANHSGLIYPGPPEDDDGDGKSDDQHLMFTFPGSALMAKTIQEVGQSLGWADSDLIAAPLYSSMSSQVRYVNPSLSNPFGFSITPMIGMPLRVMRALFPKSDSAVTNTLGRLEGGGERFFAEQGILQSILPTPIAKLIPVMTDDETEGQLASAVRNSIVYYGAAGLLPDDHATDDQVEEAHEAIKDMAINQLIWRTVVGTFSPWAPQYNSPKGTGLPDPNVIDLARGIRDIRGEWFDLIGQASDKVGGEAAVGEASAEWFKRHPEGGSILNPTAFTVGTTDNPNNAGEAPNIASGLGLTKWMMDNKSWIEDNQTVAYYLLPNYMEAQYSAQGMRDQIRNGLRVHRDGSDMYDEMRYQSAMHDYWAHVDDKNRQIGLGRPKQVVNDEFDKWEKGWLTAHPATAREKASREDPQYVKGKLAPALQRMVESGSAPAGVDLASATAVWNHYKEYEDKYNKSSTGTQGKYERSHLNKVYRDDGNAKFLGTPAHDLWKAMDIYEDGN